MVDEVLPCRLTALKPQRVMLDLLSGYGILWSIEVIARQPTNARNNVIVAEESRSDSGDLFRGR
jgi:hypothetical protein